jgi:hypothetical protein
LLLVSKVTLLAASFGLFILGRTFLALQSNFEAELLG